MQSGIISTRVWTCLFIGSLSAVTACEQASDNQVTRLEAALKADRGSHTNGDRGPNVDQEDNQAQKDLDQGRRRRLQPLLVCVEELSGQRLLAHWGYQNDNSKAVRRTLGRQNGFAPAPSNRGQPTKFEPGVTTDVFTTAFPSNTKLTWTLDGSRAVADVGAKRCSQGAAGSAGGGAAGSSGSSGSSGSGDTCKQCESIPHTFGGTLNTNCPDSTKWCDSVPGTSAAGSPKPGVARSTLCHEALDCIHKTGCAAYATTDCLCGPNTDPGDCFGKTFEAVNGVCKQAVAAAAESTDMNVLLQRFFDNDYASGAASSVVETCDQFFCVTECLTPKSATGSGSRDVLQQEDVR